MGLYLLAQATQEASGSNFDSWIPVIIALIGTGGIGGAIVAFLKVRPEAGQIAVTASQGALVVQTGVIDTLNKENVNLRNRLENLESKVGMLGDLKERIEVLEDEKDELRRKNEKLRKRIVILENKLKELGAEVPPNGH